MESSQEKLRGYYHALSRAWGPQNWWPAQSRFEVIVGAYLTQNTAWTNVERALRNLRRAGCLSLSGIRTASGRELETLIRPSGYFRQKARRLKGFVAWLDDNYGGSLDRMFRQPTDRLRAEFLALNGVGPETADSILLYAGQHPVFVVDAYTRRVFERHGILSENSTYDEIRTLVEQALAPVEFGASRSIPTGMGASHAPSRMSLAKRSARVQVYNEMHGLIVGVGKHHCGKSHPQCDGCPLQPFLPSIK